MKVDEALKELLTKVYRNTNDFEMKISKDCYKIIINALEKQIPKKPKDYLLSDGQCPTCNAVFDYDWKPKSRFCQNCGQRLDWSDT